VLGFFPQGDKKITDVKSCPQLEKGLEAALTAIRTHLLPGLSARGEVSALLGNSGKCHVSVHGSASRKSVEALNADDAIAGVIHGTRSFGDGSVNVEGDISSHADSFAQASVAGNEALCALVQDAMGPLEGKRVLELYAGNGNFTRLLTKASEVVAVESDASPGESDANVSWRQGDAVAITEKMAAGSETFDVVLLDPPRSGAREAMASIAALQPKRIVYVSCDVATLARDVEVLTELGYQAKTAQPIDLMPQTAQVEVVMVLEA